MGKKKAEKRKTSSPEGKDLDGKVVVLRKKDFHLGAYPENYLFKCEGGFGCKPYCAGRAVFGKLVNGPNAGVDIRVERYNIEYVVEE